MPRKITQVEANIKVNEKCYKNNITLLEEFTFKTVKSTILYLKCPVDNFEWSTNYYNFISRDYGCPKCSGKFKTQEEVELLVNKRCEDLGYTLLNPFTYVGSQTYFLLKCNKDNHEWKVIYNDFINGKRRCPKCAGNLSLTQKDVEIKVKDICDECNYILLKSFIYKNQRTKIYLKCTKDGYEWSTSYDNLVHNNRRCPKCSESKGEKIIDEYLKNKNFVYNREHRFKDCKYKKCLAFDFYLPKQNICIEYDGEQHFKSVKYWGGEKNFDIIKIRDNIKFEYCKNKNIKLIRISHINFNVIKEILDNEICGRIDSVQ
jgi:hypothetical protein